MTRVPDAIFVVDPKKEKICVQEAHNLGITLIGIGDTNCDPEEIDYPIPGNDDATKSVGLIISLMTKAIEEGLSERKVEKEMDKEKETSSEEVVESKKFVAVDDEDDDKSGKKGPKAAPAGKPSARPRTNTSKVPSKR